MPAAITTMDADAPAGRGSVAPAGPAPEDTNPERAAESSNVLGTVRSVFSLLASYGLLLLANGMFGTLLGVRSKIEGFETQVVGLIMAAYFLGLLQGALRAGNVVAAVGHIRAFAALLHVMVVDPLLWCVLRFASGFCMAGMILVTESWLNARSTNRTRGQVMALYMVTNYFAAGCGQFLLTAADPARFELFSVASIIFDARSNARLASVGETSDFTFCVGSASTNAPGWTVTDWNTAWNCA